MKITRIVSGAQTGADRGGLDAAMHCRLPYGGWVPKGRLAEDGTVPAAYGCVREARSADYAVRTKANVSDSDATVVLCFGPPTRGSRLTLTQAKKHGRPSLAVDLNEGRTQAVERIVTWLRSLPKPEGVLNVAGARESKSAGIQELVRAVMVDALSQMGNEPDGPPPPLPEQWN